jgi:hypothetical protein
VPNLAECASRTVPSTTQDDALDEDRCDSGLGDLVVEESAIDEVVLGAPLAEGPGEQPRPRIMAGCMWDSNNWSCAYDTVFMSFWSIYRKSSPGWRDRWRRQAPDWNNFLGAAFDFLLAMDQNGRTSQTALSREFTSFRETFRDKLSQVNSTYFRRHGRVPASVCRILGHIFSRSVEREPHLNQVVVCNQCGTTMHNRCSFALLGSTELLNEYLNEDDVSPFLPLQTAVTRYIQRLSQEPHCEHRSTCSGRFEVDSLSFPETTWLWFELCDLVSPVKPSPRLVFGLPDQWQVFTLQAVIYLGGGHFTARLYDQSTMWWRYDDQWRFGAPRVDRVEDEADLLENDHRRATFLLYSRADLED